MQGWYIITYALAIYILSLFIAFLSPKFDPAAEDDYDNGKLFIRMSKLLSMYNFHVQVICYPFAIFIFFFRWTQLTNHIG